MKGGGEQQWGGAVCEDVSSPSRRCVFGGGSGGGGRGEGLSSATFSLSLSLSVSLPAGSTKILRSFSPSLARRRFPRAYRPTRVRQALECMRTDALERQPLARVRPDGRPPCRPACGRRDRTLECGACSGCVRARCTIGSERHAQLERDLGGCGGGHGGS